MLLQHIAEAEGFEPPVGFILLSRSKRVHLAALPRFQVEYKQTVRLLVL